MQVNGVVMIKREDYTDDHGHIDRQKLARRLRNLFASAKTVDVDGVPVDIDGLFVASCDAAEICDRPYPRQSFSPQGAGVLFTVGNMTDSEEVAVTASFDGAHGFTLVLSRESAEDLNAKIAKALFVGNGE